MNFCHNPAAEKRGLFILGACLAAATGAVYLVFGGVIIPIALMVLSFLAFAGRLFYKFIGRDVYVVFAVISACSSRFISAAIVIFMYTLVICVFGSLLRLFGMNQLNRDFVQRRNRESMFAEAPITDGENLRRQS